MACGSLWFVSKHKTPGTDHEKFMQRAWHCSNIYRALIRCISYMPSLSLLPTVSQHLYIHSGTKHLSPMQGTDSVMPPRKFIPPSPPQNRNQSLPAKRRTARNLYFYMALRPAAVCQSRVGWLPVKACCACPDASCGRVSSWSRRLGRLLAAQSLLPAPRGSGGPKPEPFCRFGESG